jgi:glycosyltransferase involved in cell wall biosynthesis
MNPKVSIVIPVYNGANYLAAAIDSALDQTYNNIEVIVVNDGSSDQGATRAIAQSYGDRIKYYEKANGHVASALNFGIRHMSGEYFSWLSHDDLYYPDKVASEVEALTALESQKTVVYGDHAVFSNSPDEASEIRLPHVPPEQFRYFLTTLNVLHGCTLLVPRSAFEECGLFNERLRTTQDYDLWFRLAEQYRFVHVPKLLVKARQHAEQGTITMSGIALAECDELLTGFVEKLSEVELTASTGGPISLAYANVAASMRSRGFSNAARTASALAAKHMGKGAVRDDLKSAVVLLRAKWVDTVRAKCRQLLVRLRRSDRLAQLMKRGLAPHSGAMMPRDLREKFTHIYSQNTFGGANSRSGEGSNMVQTVEIRRVLPQLVQEYGIESFLDSPCGD